MHRRSRWRSMFFACSVPRKCVPLLPTNQACTSAERHLVSRQAERCYRPVNWIGGAGASDQTLGVASPADLLCAVTERPEDLVTLRSWRTTKKGLAEKRIHVFPDNLSFFGDFEEATEGRLGDQRVAVRQALSVAHARREEIPGRLVLVLPFDLVCGWIDLDHPRIRHRVIETMRPVIEYQDIAVLQQRRRMLAGNCGWPKL